MPRLPYGGAHPHHDETLGEYVRRVYPLEPDRLTPSERAIARAEIEWTAANAELAERLDAFMGYVLKLKADRITHSDHTIPAGRRFTVRARFFDRFLCVGVDDALLLLKPDWLELVEES